MRRTSRVLILVWLLLGLNPGPPGAVALGPADMPARSARLGTARTDWASYQGAPDAFELVAENALFQLLANPTTLAFRVVDKRNGYVWHSNLEEVSEDDKLNKTWTAFARSGISINYLDEKAITKRASITNADHSLDFQRIAQGFEATVRFADASITIVVTVRLEEHGVVVEVPCDGIQEENPEFKLGVLHVYPFFGATKEDTVPGYMFIPDGAGTLIRFAATTKATNMFYGRYYGSDVGMIGILPWDPEVRRPYKLSIPVVGMVHGEKQNAYISIVENGASYGEVQAHPAGVTTRFNFLYTAFIYNESYFQATNRAGAGVTALQRGTNAFDVKMHYRFLSEDDSDYVGMARSYQQYLIEAGMLKQVPDGDGDIGIRLEFLGGEKERVLFWNRAIPMTTVGQMAAILADLEVKNPEVVYYGWQPGGAASMPPRSLKLERSLGSIAELRSLAGEVAAGGGRFYLYLDPQAALRGEGGYSPRRDLAMSIANDSLKGFNRDKANFYLNLAAVRDRYSGLGSEVFSDLGAGVALDGISSTLYSDFKSGNFLNREGAIDGYQNLLAAHDGTTAFYKPNDYMFGLMDAYYDMPLSNSGYIYATEAVPFLQIVLAGYVPYYGPALNFSSNPRDDLLRQADFGVYPSYFLSHEPTAKILNTSSMWIYSSSYEQWGQEIEETYQWLNGLLRQVKGQTIVSRQVLGEGVVATTYSNGKQIIVNYSGTPFSAGELTVNAKDAAIREVQP